MKYYLKNCEYPGLNRRPLRYQHNALPTAPYSLICIMRLTTYKVLELPETGLVLKYMCLPLRHTGFLSIPSDEPDMN